MSNFRDLLELKVKATATIVLPDGEEEIAEIHWYEEPSVGKVKVKKACK